MSTNLNGHVTLWVEAAHAKSLLNFVASDNVVVET